MTFHFKKCSVNTLEMFIGLSVANMLINSKKRHHRSENRNYQLWSYWPLYAFTSIMNYQGKMLESNCACKYYMSRQEGALGMAE